MGLVQPYPLLFLLLKESIETVPSTCAHRATQLGWGMFEFLPSPNAVESHDRVIHEWLGLLWYGLRGYL
jgi:hypothetical protein